MSGNNGPYGIGSDTWPGLAKLLEECGEVIQVLSKLMAKGNLNHVWTEVDGTPRGWGDLTDPLHEELGDLQAALTFFCMTNDDVDVWRVAERTSEKYTTFQRWHAEGLAKNP